MEFKYTYACKAIYIKHKVQNKVILKQKQKLLTY